MSEHQTKMVDRRVFVCRCSAAAVGAMVGISACRNPELTGSIPGDAPGAGLPAGVTRNNMMLRIHLNTQSQLRNVGGSLAAAGALIVNVSLNEWRCLKSDCPHSPPGLSVAQLRYQGGELRCDRDADAAFDHFTGQPKRAPASGTVRLLNWTLESSGNYLEVQLV